MDGAGPVNFNQTVFKDFELDGTWILKGTDIQYDLAAIHVNQTEWQFPYDFLPNRFDPESPLYKKPDGTARSNFAFIPFLWG